jgi:hypothetical protein
MGEKGMEASPGVQPTVGGTDASGLAHTPGLHMDPQHVSGSPSSSPPAGAVPPPPGPHSDPSPSAEEVVEDVIDPLGVRKVF